MSARWGDYWARPGAGPRRDGCLPNAARGARPVLDGFWQDFARTLPRKGRLLDLATGDGAVLRLVRRVRPDLALTGVDSAPLLPPAPQGIVLRADTPMEALPFMDGRFDGVSSQFGVEYGDTAKAAGEAARVLGPGGRLALAVHHAESVIVRHNLERRLALSWAIGESGLLDKARKLARARTAAALPTPSSFREAIARAQALWPSQGAPAEIATAIADTLDLGAKRPPAETMEVLATLEARARAEIGRLDALAEAARDEAAIGALADELAAAGFVVERPRALAGAPGGTEPVAWAVAARRA